MYAFDNNIIYCCFYFFGHINKLICFCSFEQEVLGGPVPVSGNPSVIEAIPVALAVPVVRPIIGTNTYRQVCMFLVFTLMFFFM